MSDRHKKIRRAGYDDAVVAADIEAVSGAWAGVSLALTKEPGLLLAYFVEEEETYQVWVATVFVGELDDDFDPDVDHRFEQLSSGDSGTGGRQEADIHARTVFLRIDSPSYVELSIAR